MARLIHTALALFIGLMAYTSLAADTPTAATSDAFRLLGVWQSNCYNTQTIINIPSKTYSLDAYSFGANGTYALQTTRYADAACSQPLGNSVQFFGEYALGETLEGTHGRERRVLLTLDNADWPADIPATRLDWVLHFSKDKLLLGPYNAAGFTPFQGYWLEKALLNSNGVFVF